MNLKKLCLVGSALTAVAAVPTYAQDIDSNFNRNQSTAVLDRAQGQFGADGIHAGAFSIFPTVGVLLGADDNIYATASNKKSDVFLDLSPAIEARSLWSRHSLSAGFTSDITQYASATSENTTSWDVHAAGLYDVASFLQFTGSLRHARGYLSRSSFEAFDQTKKPIGFDTDTVSAGFKLTGNRLRLLGSVDHSEQKYENGVSSTNPAVIIPETERNNVNTNYSARVDYALSPDVSLFVNLQTNKRTYGNLALYESTGNTVSLGTSFDLNHLARGEVELGSQSQNYKKSGLGKQSSSYARAKVLYFPTELTTVTGTASRSYVDTPYLGANTTSLQTQLGLSVDHELLRNLILSANLLHSKYEYQGVVREDKSDSFGFGARYYLSRRTYVKVDYAYQKYDASGASVVYRKFTDNSLRANLVLAY